MQTVDDQPETIHLYVVREAPKPPSWLPVVLTVIALSALVILCVVSPYRQPDVRKTIRIPAVFLPLQTFSTTVPIMPTGTRTYPATCAYGRLTITNGTVIAQTIPAGFRFAGVATSAAVFVPAGSANGYGVTAVEAQAVTCGKTGNYPAYALNYTLGAGVYIRNLSAFHGGKDAYTVPVQLPQDKHRALEQARTIQEHRIQGGLLASPCREAISGGEKLVVQWTCQLIAYPVIPGKKIIGVQVVGKDLFVTVLFTPPQQRLLVK